MNRIHRVVWSKARNCFVVSNEKAKAKANGKPSSTRKAIAAATVAALFLTPIAALAFDWDDPNAPAIPAAPDRCVAYCGVASVAPSFSADPAVAAAPMAGLSIAAMVSIAVALAEVAAVASSDPVSAPAEGGSSDSENAPVEGGSSGDALPMTDKHFWFKPFGSRADQDNRSGSIGYDSRSYGVVFGADSKISETDRVGAAFSYARTNVDSNSGTASSHIDSYLLSLYGRRKLNEKTHVTFLVGGGYHETDGNRTVTGIGTAHSSYDSWSVHAGAGIDHAMILREQTTFTPSVRFDYSRLRSNSFSESGVGALDLNVGRNNTEQLILALDGKLTQALTKSAKATAHLGVGYDVINERASITSSYAGTPDVAFTTQGLDPSPWLIRGGLGLANTASNGVEFSAHYDFEARQNFHNQTVSLKVRIPF